MAKVGGRLGSLVANVQNGVKFRQESSDSGGKFAARSMDVIGRPSMTPPSLLFMSFLLLSTHRGAPLIDNLVSCSLILKDVWLYNKARTGPPHLLSFPPPPLIPPQCQRLLGSQQQHLQFARGWLMSVMEAEEALRVSAQIPSDKQSRRVILLGFTLHCSPHL